MTEQVLQKMTCCNVLPLSAILNGSIAKGAGQPPHDLLPGDEGLHFRRLPAGDTSETASGDEAAMMRHMAAMVGLQFRLGPFRKTVCSSSAIRGMIPSRFSDTMTAVLLIVKYRRMYYNEA